VPESSKIIIYGKKSKKISKTFFVCENDFQSPFYNQQNILESINELKKLEKTSIEGKYLPDLLMYEGVSMWWFLYPILSQKFFTHVGFISNFSKFIKEEKPEIVKITDDFSNFNIIKQICYQQNVKLRISNWNHLKFKISKKIINKLRKYNSKRITNRKIDRRKKMFFKKNDSIPTLNDKIIFTSTPTYRRHIFDIQEGVSTKGEFLIQNLVNLIDDKKKIIGIDLFSHVLLNDTTLEERMNSRMTWIPVEALLQKIHPNKHKHFLEKYEKLLNSKEFQKLFEFKKIKYWEQLVDNFHEMKFDYYLPYWLALYDSLKRFFSNNKPKCLFLIYEHGPLSIAFIAVCKKLGIQTIGIQHAMIYDYHSQYLHDNFYTPDNPQGFLFPNKMILFGEYFKNILLKNGYPKENLVTFGNPAFFNLEKIESILQNNNLLDKYGINENKIVILFTSTRLQEGYEVSKKYNYDSQIWNNLLKDFGNDDRFFVILKPHPQENTAVYEEILKKNNTPLNAKIIQNDLLELIYISSIVVSVYSTTILDSLCLKKPVITVEFDEIKFPISLGNAIKTTKLDDLKKTILEIINDNDVKNGLLRNSGDFIKKIYNIPEQNPRTIIDKLIEDQ